MPLDISTTVSDIKAAEDALGPTATETERLTALVTAIYNRIKADGLVTVTGTATVTTAPGSAPVTGTGTIS